MNTKLYSEVITHLAKLRFHYLMGGGHNFVFDAAIVGFIYDVPKKYVYEDVVGECNELLAGSSK